MNNKVCAFEQIVMHRIRIKNIKNCMSKHKYKRTNTFKVYIIQNAKYLSKKNHFNLLCDFVDIRDVRKKEEKKRDILKTQ